MCSRLYSVIASHQDLLHMRIIAAARLKPLSCFASIGLTLLDVWSVELGIRKILIPMRFFDKWRLELLNYLCQLKLDRWFRPIFIWLCCIILYCSPFLRLVNETFALARCILLIVDIFLMLLCPNFHQVAAFHLSLALFWSCLGVRIPVHIRIIIIAVLLDL